MIYAAIIRPPDSTARQIDILSGTLTEQVNSIPQLQISTADGCSDVLQYVTGVTLYAQGGTVVFDGRVLSVGTSLTSEGKMKTEIIAEDKLGWLCDSLISLSYPAGTLLSTVLDKLQSNHTAICGAAKSLTIYTSKPTAIPEELDGSVRTTFQWLVELAQMCGLEFRRVGDEVEFGIFGDTASEPIAVNHNIQSFTRTADFQGIVTRLYPYGGKVNGGVKNLTIAPANQGREYLDNSALIAKYGVICGTASFPEIDCPDSQYITSRAAKLKAKAQAYFDSLNKNFEQFDIQALDLSDDKNFAGLRLYDTYTIYVPMHDERGELSGRIVRHLRVVGKKTPLESPYKPSLTFGAPSNTLTRKLSGAKNYVYGGVQDEAGSK